jgi:phosphoribosylformylglycinamidine synthase subunit PurL
MNIAVLSSTNGTDLQMLIDKKEKLPATLKIVICNKECGALERAQKNGIKSLLIISKGKEREFFDNEVSVVLEREQIDYIFLIGYMRILSATFCKRWKGKIINIHPSLLPAFAGGMDVNVHQAVLDYGCKISGCTLHYVTEDIDGGAIIMQRAVSIDKGETVETLKAKVQQVEQQVIIEAIINLSTTNENGGKDEKNIVDKERYQKHLNIVDTKNMSDKDLQYYLKKNGITLTVYEARLIEKKLKRSPTLTELHIFNIEWSEHCSYKSSKEILKLLPTSASNVIQGPQEDAGIIELTTINGERVGLVMAHESHNHPSQVVPYEGAATGIGGVIRDVLCMGAQILGTANPLRFGDPNGKNKQKIKYIANSVIDGIAGYGNPLGIPVLAGDVYFNNSFNSNCIVNVVCLGMVKERNIIHSCVPENSVGHDIIVIGKATDNSGFGGASFASVVLQGEQNKGAVQVPDPFLKNMLVRATHAVFEEARRNNTIIGFKDCGAGGIMCASSELGADGGKGMEIDIDCIHTSMTLPPYIIACAETQERFVMITPPYFTPKVLKIYNEDFALPTVAQYARASVIGKVTDNNRYVMKYNSQVVCDAPIAEITSGIKYHRESSPSAKTFIEPALQEKENYNETVLQVLNHPNVASKAKAFKHYDTEVLGNAVIRAGEADAGVIAPLPGKKVGVALSVDCNPMYTRIDPYKGAALAVIESMRNIVAVGATPRAMTDCLCNGNPEKPEEFWAFTQNVKGIADAARALWQKGTREPVPFVSGNVSFYNESATQSVDPSPIIACVGLLKDYSTAITMRLKRVESILCLIGKRKDECGGSIYYQMHHQTGKNLPSIDFEEIRKQLYAVIDAIGERKVLSCHDISDGGIVATISEMILGGNADGIIGAELHFLDSIQTDKLLFSETGGFVLEIDEQHTKRVKALCQFHQIELIQIGKTTAKPHLTIFHEEKKVVSLSVEQLKNAWTTGFVEALQ